MRRRTYLAGAAVTLVGGVLGLVYVRDGVPRTVSVAAAEATGVEFAAEMAEPRVTKEHTARVRLTWTNRSSERVDVPVDRGTDADPQFSFDGEFGGYESNRSMILVEASSSAELEKKRSNCWKLTRRLPIDGDEERTRLAPGESLQNDYELWTKKPTIECHQAGTYLFGGGRDDEEVWWRLVLKVER